MLQSRKSSLKERSTQLKSCIKIVDSLVKLSKLFKDNWNRLLQSWKSSLKEPHPTQMFTSKQHIEPSWFTDALYAVKFKKTTMQGQVFQHTFVFSVYLGTWQAVYNILYIDAVQSIQRKAFGSVHCTIMYYCTVHTGTVRFSKPLFVFWHFGLLDMSVVSLFYLGTNYIHKHSTVDPPLSNVGIKESHLVQYYCRVQIGTARFSKPLLLLWHFGPLDMSGNPEALQGNPVTWVSNVMGGRLILLCVCELGSKYVVVASWLKEHY